GGGVEESGFRSLWIGGAGSRLSVQRTAMPAVHPHHLHQRPAAGRTRQRVSQSGRHLDRGGLTAAPTPAAAGTRSLRQGRASLTRPRAWAASHTKKWRPRRNLQPASIDLRRPTVPRAFLGTPITRRARLRRVALSRRLSRFVIANHARAYRPWL